MGGKRIRKSAKKEGRRVGDRKTKERAEATEARSEMSLGREGGIKTGDVLRDGCTHEHEKGSTLLDGLYSHYRSPPWAYGPVP